MDDATKRALGIVTDTPRQVEKSGNRVDLSRAIMLKFKHGLEQVEIARMMGVSESSISKALKPYKNLMAQTGPNASDDAMGELLSAAATVHLAASADPEKVAKMSGRDNAVAAGIFLDKSRLFKGQATSQVSVFFQVVSESDKSRVIDVTPAEPPAEEYILE